MDKCPELSIMWKFKDQYIVTVKPYLGLVRLSPNKAVNSSSTKYTIQIPNNIPHQTSFLGAKNTPVPTI